MTRIYVAANRGDIGGGEVMLLRLAAALAELGYDITAVVPSTPSNLAVQARAAGVTVEVVSCHDRPSYARALRRWDRGREGVLWCNGLLPALATTGRPRRIVHLHQMPFGFRRPLARLARIGAAATVVPSRYLADRLAPAEVLPNWTDALASEPQRRASGEQVSVGFIGRVGLEKGVHVLASACARLDPALRARVHLVIAGDDRFVPSADRRTVQAALASSGVVVEQTGWIPPKEFFSRVDLVVVPSVRAESFGLVAAEAMASCCPVIVTDAGGLAEVAGPAHPWVVPRGDAAALARTLTEAISALPADDLTAAQHRRWEVEYSPAAGREHLQALVDRLVDRGILDAALPRADQVIPDAGSDDRPEAYGEAPR
jgi:glycosyltransferase involved in cell wall biosynthesis